MNVLSTTNRTSASSAMYAQSHLPGAHFASVDHDLSAPVTGKNGRHPLPDIATFAAWLGNKGVTNGVQVVGYDDSLGVYPSRLWWMLRWLGHDAVAVLDGGLNAWVKAGLPTTTEVPVAKPAQFIARPRDTTKTFEPGVYHAVVTLIDDAVPVDIRLRTTPRRPRKSARSALTAAATASSGHSHATPQPSSRTASPGAGFAPGPDSGVVMPSKVAIASSLVTLMLRWNLKTRRTT